MQWSPSLSLVILRGRDGALSLPAGHRRKVLFLAATVLLLVLSAPGTISAGSATWSGSPGSGNWNVAGNWVPTTVPNSSADTATFGTSNTTGVFLSADTEVNRIHFNPGASGYTLSTGFVLTISGAGIANNSGTTQNFVLGAAPASSMDFGGTIQLMGSATVGGATVFTLSGGTSNLGLGGAIGFLGSSSAGSGTFVSNGGAVANALGSAVAFAENSTAGNGTFTTHASAASGASSGFVGFSSNASAGNATFTNNAATVSNVEGGTTILSDNSTASNATFINNGSVCASTGGKPAT